MSNQGLDYLPFDMTSVQRKGGFKPYPEGAYLLRVAKTDEIRTVKDGSHQRRTYQSEIVMGPGYSEEFKGKPFYERLSMEPEEAGRHFDLFCACFGGSEENVRQMAMQHGGKLAPEMLHGRCYIVNVVVNGTFNNVNSRLPYNDPADFQAAVGGAAAPAPSPGIMTPTSVATVPAPGVAAPAPAPMAAPPVAAPAPMAAPPAPMAAPAPAPAPAPVAAPVAAPAPAPAPTAAPGIPAPPPPPGTIAGQ